MLKVKLPPMRSWTEFLDTATRTPTLPDAESRRTDHDEWQGGTWAEALRLAVDGWPLALAEADVTVPELQDGAGLSHSVTMLEPVWDVTGAEVDVGAYLSGIPECMVDAVPRQVSRRGKVVTFLVPAGYGAEIDHDRILNRGLALATLCTAILDAGHSVEVWSGNAGWLDLPDRKYRYCGVTRVIGAGEPFDPGRLIFAMAHPAMLRRLWFGVWDAQPADVVRAKLACAFGYPPFDCKATDLPPEIVDPYVLPYLSHNDYQWKDLPSALAWSRRKFREFGLVEH